MKYELTDETTNHLGVTLYRIRATKDFGNVKKGQLGGFIQSDNNLSHYGNAWVYGNARVFGDARVSGNARVSRPPKVLTGFKHMVTITDHHIAAGCEMHTLDMWKERGVAIIRADGNSTKQSKEWQAIIVAIGAAHGCTNPPNKDTNQ